MVTIGIISILFCVPIQSFTSHHSHCYVLPGKQTSTCGPEQAQTLKAADLSRAECAGEQVTRSKAGEQAFIPRKISMHRPRRLLRKHSFMKSFPPVLPRESQPSIFLLHLQLSESFPEFLGSGQQKREGRSIEDHMWEAV